MIYLKKNQTILFGRKIENSFLFIENKYTLVTKINILDMKIDYETPTQYVVSYDKKKDIFRKHTAFNKTDIPLDKELESFLNYSVNVRSKTKGKGFQGVVKRHGFSKGPRSHGSSKFHRRPGSIGSGQTFPARVLKGAKMPGNMGNKNVTIKNLKILKIKENCIFIKGSVPGSKKNHVRIIVDC